MIDQAELETSEKELKPNYTVYENVTIKCNVNAYMDGQELPKIQWKRNHTENIQGKESSSLTSFLSEISFSPPRRNDSGNYTCSVVSTNSRTSVLLSQQFELIFLCRSLLDYFFSKY